jgi:hypothetical protein
MAVHNGIALYDIGLGGCLTGVYANEQDPQAGRVFNEIARRKSPTDDPQNIEGIYEAMYFEWGANHHGELHIKKVHGTNNVFDVVWILDGSAKPDYVGKGYILKPHVFVVHYESN